MLRFCGQFGSAHRSSAQFSNTYKARPICIVRTKQPFVLLAKVWFTYPVRSIQFTHSSPIVQPNSSLAQYSTHKADTTKTVNCFIFVCFSQVQKLLSSVPLAYKITSTVAFCHVKDTQQRPCQLIATVHAAAFVSVVSRWLSRSLFNTN